MNARSGSKPLPPATRTRREDTFIVSTHPFLILGCSPPFPPFYRTGSEMGEPLCRTTGEIEMPKRMWRDEDWWITMSCLSPLCLLPSMSFVFLIDVWGISHPLCAGLVPVVHIHSTAQPTSWFSRFPGHPPCVYFVFGFLRGYPSPILLFGVNNFRSHTPRLLALVDQQLCNGGHHHSGAQTCVRQEDFPSLTPCVVLFTQASGSRRRPRVMLSACLAPPQ